MATELTVKELRDVIHRSGLIAKDRLSKTLAKWTHESRLPGTAADLATQLVKEGQLTSWQAENLLRGKSRGFFLGGHRLLDHLGTGGMSSVFLAQHRFLSRQVAIKVMPSTRSEDPSFLDRFILEARVTSRLSHPNIVRLFDIDQQDGTQFMVMEFVEGEDLRAIVKRDGPMPLEQAADVVAQTASGLQHAHERGLVHRDVKPANLLLGPNGVVKILDLGLARSDDAELHSERLEPSWGMMGTADYLAPEQARDPSTVDHRADIYSLGCTFYYLLAGAPPFAEGSVSERVAKHQTEQPRDVRALREDCPHAVADVCMTMLRKERDERFASAGMVAIRLQQWLSDRGFQGVASMPINVELASLGATSIRTKLPTAASRNGDESPARAHGQGMLSRRYGAWILFGILVVLGVLLLAYFVDQLAPKT